MKNIFKLLSLSLVITLFGACSQRGDSPQLETLVSGIVGGFQTPLSPYPWQVSLQDKKGNHFCGGSIISRRAVLTAAHCLDSSKAESIQVAAGGADGKLTSQRLLPKVKSIIVHPQWEGGYAELVNHDIALVLFEKDIKFDANMKLIALPTSEFVSFSISDYFSYLSRDLVSSGWGDTRDASADRNQLNAYDVSALASARDQDFWSGSAPYEYIFHDLGRRMLGGNFLVSYTPGASTCGGDSGGPLVALAGDFFDRPILIGLTSAGGDGLCSSSVFHTDVQVYLNWIKSQLGN